MGQIAAHIDGSTPAISDGSPDAVVRQSPGVVFDSSRMSGSNNGLRDVGAESQRNSDKLGDDYSAYRQGNREQFAANTNANVQRGIQLDQANGPRSGPPTDFSQPQQQPLAQNDDSMGLHLAKRSEPGSLLFFGDY